MAAAFHGNPAPGLIIGGYMVDAARSMLPEGILFDAVVETKKCLPHAVQILTPPSYGNGWMRVVNLGRYALSLYDSTPARATAPGSIPNISRTGRKSTPGFSSSSPSANKPRALAEIVPPPGTSAGWPR